jgi:TonB family protein
VKPTIRSVGGLLVALTASAVSLPAPAAPECSALGVLNARTVDELRALRGNCSEPGVQFMALHRVNTWPLPKPEPYRASPASDRHTSVSVSDVLHYESNEAYPTHIGWNKLARFIGVLKDSSRIEAVEITGMSDQSEIGDALPLGLGMRRAHIVRQLLLDAGVADPDQITLIEHFPARAESFEDRAHRRSVVIRVRSMRAADQPLPKDWNGLQAPVLSETPSLEETATKALADVQYTRKPLAFEDDRTDAIYTYSARLKQHMRRQFGAELPSSLRNISAAVRIMFEVDDASAVRRSWVTSSTGPHALAAALQQIIAKQQALPAMPEELKRTGTRLMVGVVWEQPLDWDETRDARYMRVPKPAYPREAVYARAEGKVLIEVRVEQDGRAGQVRVLASSGHQALDQAAVDAVKWSYFAPAGVKADKGKWLRQELAFTLDKMDESYADIVRKAVQRNIMLSEEVTGNPSAEVDVQLSDDGRVISRTLAKSSGSAAWDTAVLRAVDRMGRLPLDSYGKAPPLLTLVLRPRE